MPKFPNPPPVEALTRVEAAVTSLSRGTMLARVYFTAGEHLTRWNAFRHFGPTNARFDHHLADTLGEAHLQDRAILYCAAAADTCLAEVFQDTRRINRTRRAPWLAIFELSRAVPLLDLTGAYATRAGASMAISTGHRGRARSWARAFYEVYPELHGICYPSSMNGNAAAVALNDRAEHSGCLPEHPAFNRALADDALVDVLKHSAHKLGYSLI